MITKFFRHVHEWGREQMWSVLRQAFRKGGCEDMHALPVLQKIFIQQQMPLYWMVKQFTHFPKKKGLLYPSLNFILFHNIFREVEWLLRLTP